MHVTQTTPWQSLSSSSALFLSPSSPSRRDPRQDGGSANLHCTGYEPKKIELDKNLVNPQNSTMDDQDYMEEIDVEQLAVAPQ